MTEFKAGQYWVAKYNGNNGDLIVGRVRSVRTTGEVVLVNLLTDKIATKSAKVLAVRNKRVVKAQALAVVDCYKRTGSRAKARKLAVEQEPLNGPPNRVKIDVGLVVAGKALKMHAAYLAFLDEVKAALSRLEQAIR